MFRKRYSLIAAMFLLITLFSCSGPKKVVFLIDTSGSMKTDDRISLVKKEAKRYIKKYSNSKTELSIATFDVSVREVYSGYPNKSVITSTNTLIDNLEARGQWTYMDKALDYVAEKLDTSLHVNQEAYIFTDGINDLPPGEKEIDFNQLITDRFGDKYKEDIALYIIDVSNEKTKDKNVTPWPVYKFFKYILPIILLAGLVLLILLFIGYRNRIVNDSKNIKTIACITDLEASSPEITSAKINLNRYLVFKKKIDLGKKYPAIFKVVPGTLVITIDRYETKELVSKSEALIIEGEEYLDKPWRIVFNTVFSINDQYFIIK